MITPIKRIFITGLLVSTTSFLFSQNIDSLINFKEVERIERNLSSVDMRGRRAFTPDIEKAADFIAAEFKSIGLDRCLPDCSIQAGNKNGNYRQEFILVRPKIISASATFNGDKIDPKNFLIITCREELKIDQHSGYHVAYIKAGANLRREASSFAHPQKNMLVFVDETYAHDFPRINFLRRSIFKTDKNVVFILGNSVPKKFVIEARHEINEQKMANVVGVIPGKSRKDEYVVFSGHYDHLGVGKPVDGDSIFNGANDNASGTTAVIMLAKYFTALNNNERTIVFAAFTAEEIGGYGSQYFSRQIDAEKVMAMFNIEMIGTESKWGRNSAYITGYEKTDMGQILQKNLEETEFTFYPDPYPAQQLFYRSDNATLARLGVPAHTISTSKMDSEPNYHKLSDQVETLDMENMAMIIRSIALSSKTIIAGKESPTRVKVEELR